MKVYKDAHMKILSPYIISQNILEKNLLEASLILQFKSGTF